jgi:hypothetical protein
MQLFQPSSVICVVEGLPAKAHRVGVVNHVNWLRVLSLVDIVSLQNLRESKAEDYGHTDKIHVSLP